MIEKELIKIGDELWFIDTESLDCLSGKVEKVSDEDHAVLNRTDEKGQYIVKFDGLFCSEIEAQLYKNARVYDYVKDIDSANLLEHMFHYIKQDAKIDAFEKEAIRCLIDKWEAVK